jgi:hypothetical protein
MDPPHISPTTTSDQGLAPVLHTAPVLPPGAHLRAIPYKLIARIIPNDKKARKRTSCPFLAFLYDLVEFSKAL